MISSREEGSAHEERRHPWEADVTQTSGSKEKILVAILLPKDLRLSQTGD